MSAFAFEDTDANGTVRVWHRNTPVALIFPGGPSVLGPSLPSLYVSDQLPNPPAPLTPGFTHFATQADAEAFIVEAQS